MLLNVFSTTILTTGFLVAFFHAILPTHWLPFVLACHGQKWSRSKTLLITASSGFAHALFTMILGILVVFVGMSAKDWNEDIFHVVAGLILIAVGSYYIIRQMRGIKGHCCHHHHDHDDPMTKLRGRSDKAVIIGLLTMLALSPCEGFLPVYLSGIHYGWSGFVALSVVLTLATISGMVFFTWIALMGWERLRLNVLERYESVILGVLLCVLGIIVMCFEY
jgi:nickel/cobalt exporter